MPGTGQALRGRVKVKVLPRSGSLSAHMLPPCASTIPARDRQPKPQPVAHAHLAQRVEPVVQQVGGNPDARVLHRHAPFAPPVVKCLMSSA